MKTTRILALVLALSMLIVSAALADWTIDDKPISDEVLTYTALVSKATDSADWNDMWCFDWIEENLGIRFEFTCIDDSVWKEKLALAFVTGELPDCFLYGLTANDIVTYCSQGYFLDLTDLIAQHAPNVQEVFSTYEDVRKAVTTPDGAIYCIPGVTILPRELSKQRPYLNLQWLENLGLEEPETTEDLFNIFVAIKEQDADLDGDPDNEIPVGGRFEKLWNEVFFTAAFGYADTRWDIKDDGSVIFVPADENYYYFLEYMNSMWDAELIDPEMFSQTEDQYSAKCSSKAYGFFQTAGANWTLMPNEEDHLQYSMIEPVTSPVNDEKIWPATSVNLKYSFAITENCEKPEVLVKFLNWCYTVEGSIVVQYGPELGTYSDLNGWYWADTTDGYAAMISVFDNTKYSSFNNFRLQEISPMRMPYSNTPLLYEGVTNVNGDQIPIDFYSRLNKLQVLLTSDVLTHGEQYYKTGYPQYVMTTEAENTRIAQLDSDIESFVKQSVAKFINGEVELTEESFAAYIDGLKARGLDDYIALKQEIYNRYNQ